MQSHRYPEGRKRVLLIEEAERTRLTDAELRVVDVGENQRPVHL